MEPSACFTGLTTGSCCPKFRWFLHGVARLAKQRAGRHGHITISVAVDALYSANPCSGLLLCVPSATFPLSVIACLCSRKPVNAMSLVEHILAPRAPQLRRQMWFDILPLEVLAAIALHASHGKQTPDCLNIAQVSPKLRQGLLSALNNRLSLPELCDYMDVPARRLTAEDVHGWAHLLGNDIEELDVDGDFVNLFTHHCIVDMLRAPRLRRATIPDEPHILRTASESRSIQELYIRLRNYRREDDRSRQFFEQALSSLSLKKLHLICCDYDRSLKCPFRNERYLNPQYRNLPTSFATLEVLEIDCARAGRTTYDPIWRMFPAATCLRELTFHEDMPDEHLQRVQRLDTVKIRSGPNAFEIAVRIGRPVKELCIEAPLTLSADQIRNLRPLLELTTLRLDICSGAEDALQDLTRALRDLRRLDLGWGKPSICKHGVDRDHNPCYAQPRPSAVSKAIQETRLTELTLRKVCLPQDELGDILRHLGDDLEVFRICVADQDESQKDRLEALLYLTAQYNTSLRRLEAHTDVWERDASLSRSQVRAQGSRLRRAVRMLQQRAPHLNITGNAFAIES